MTRQSANHTLSFDIFCHVIDNYGDIGVCWRLARQLATTTRKHTVRLWVDDLDRFKKLEPGINTSLQQQKHCNIDIVRWDDTPPALIPNDVVIEAFACTPPPAFIDAMVKRDSLWLNLEYLSAEAWVDDFHLRPSLQANGLRKYFFFPGFTTASGGLLREPELQAQRHLWQSQPNQRNHFLQSCGVPGQDITALINGARLIFLFCYPDAPVPALIKLLAQQQHPSIILVPERVYPLENMPNVDSTGSTLCGTVKIRTIPFVDQTAFDRLLWSADLNIVRGEDSLVRALWAARPMIWQPYHQDDDTHLVKLDAWLSRSPLHPDTQLLIRSWSTGDLPLMNHAFNQHLQPPAWNRWFTQSQQWANQLSEQRDLVTSLVDFSTQQLRKG